MNISIYHRIYMLEKEQDNVYIYLILPPSGVFFFTDWNLNCPPIVDWPRNL